MDEPIDYDKPVWIVILIALVSALIAVAIIRDTLTFLDSIENVSWWLGVLLLSILLSLIPIKIIHEKIHSTVGSLLGYDPIIHRDWGLPNAVAYHDQFITSNHNIISLLSPLVVINGVAATIIVANVHQFVSYSFGIVFLVNTVASAHDIYAAYYDHRLPDGAEIYITEYPNRDSYIYIPKDKSEQR